MKNYYKRVTWHQLVFGISIGNLFNVLKQHKRYSEHPFCTATRFRRTSLVSFYCAFRIGRNEPPPPDLNPGIVRPGSRTPDGIGTFRGALSVRLNATIGTSPVREYVGIVSPGSTSESRLGVRWLSCGGIYFFLLLQNFFGLYFFPQGRLSPQSP